MRSCLHRVLNCASATALSSLLLMGCGAEVVPPNAETGVAASAKPNASVVAETPMDALRSAPVTAGSIVLNQHGFAPNATKTAILIRTNRTPVAFTVTDASGAVVLSGMSVNFGAYAGSGQSTHRIDLSALRTTGTGYRVRVGGQASAPFDIVSRPYEQLVKDAAAYFYMSRSGASVDTAYVPTRTPTLARSAGHFGEVLTCFSGTDERGTSWPGCSFSQDVTGGWYDAGDYGKYTTNTGVSIWKLLNTYERARYGSQTCATNFKDGTLQMPENNDGVNDLLNEARIGIEYMMAMQVKDSAPVGVLRGTQPASGPLRVTQENAAGLVFHKAHGIRWPSDAVAPAQDNIPRALYPPSTAAALHLAAIGAQCSRIWRRIDTTFADQCLVAAETAYAAAKRMPDAYSYNNFTGGGPYNDTNNTDELAWAATELLLTTGKAEYEADLTVAQPAIPGFRDIDWRSVDYLGPLSMVSVGQRVRTPSPRLVRAREAMIGLAEHYVGQTQDNGFDVPYAGTNFYWGSNNGHLNRAIVMSVAHDMTGDPALKKGVVDVMDYLLGRNAVGRSWITGYGDTPYENPHHRFWGHSKDANLPKPPPGVVSGGPNNTDMVDPVAMQLRGTCVGQACWADDYDAYALNEVTIGWNAALVNVAHWLDTSDDHCIAEDGDFSEFE